MAPWRIPWLRFFPRAEDDASSSEKLVRPLALSDATKQFVWALKAPQSSAVVYILAAEHLSEQSVKDTNFLIGSVKPQAVVVQIEPDSLATLRLEEQNVEPFDTSLSAFPTSALDVLKESFLDRMNKTNSYEGRASVEVLKGIFGTSFYGHVLKAKEAAKAHDAQFSYLETPHKEIACNYEAQDDEVAARRAMQSLSSGEDRGRAGVIRTSVAGIKEISGISSGFTTSSKVFGFKVTPVFPNREVSKLAQQRVSFEYPSWLPLDSYLLRATNSSSLTSFRDSLQLSSTVEIDGSKCPSFAISLYPLLEELYRFANGKQDIQNSMQCTQKMLFDIESGREVDKNDLAQAQKFRLAVEGLRVALNEAARRPVQENRSSIDLAQFENLPYEDKCHVVLAQALQQQLRKFTSVVAVMDASSLAGIRRYWKTDVATEVAILAQQCVASDSFDAGNCGAFDSKKLEKQLTMVGASTVTAMGIASLSWWAPVSSFTKMFIFKVPTIAKFGMLQTKRNMMLAAFKALYPAAKVATPGKLFLSPASQASMMIKSATSAGKARLISQSVVTTAERASLSAIRTAIYYLMRKHRGSSTGVRPWLMLGSSVVVGVGIVANAKSIESALEAAPAASTIARLGRGLKNLQHTYLALSQDDRTHIWTNYYNALYGLDKD